MHGHIKHYQGETMLRIYVADDCPGSPLARRRAISVQQQAPDIPCEVVNISIPGAILPSTVFGTPTYTWNDHILFLGNPSEHELLERVRRFYAKNTHRETDE